MNVVFRADASQEIGTGRVMRCLTLAQTLRDKNVRCRFVCREYPGNLLEVIRQHGFETQALPMEVILHQQIVKQEPRSENVHLHSDWQSYVHTPLSPTYSVENGDFCIEVTFKPTAMRDTRFLTNTNSWNSDTWAFHFNHPSYPGKMSIWVYNISSNTPILVTTTDMDVDVEHTLAFTKSGDMLRLFVDGIEEANFVKDPAINIASQSSSHVFQIGGTGWFDGYIDEVCLTKGVARYTENYTPATTKTDLATDPYADNIAFLATFEPQNSDTWQYVADNGTPFTMNPNSSYTPEITTESKYGTHSMYFDKSAHVDYRGDFTPAIGTGDYTLELLFKPMDDNDQYAWLVDHNTKDAEYKLYYRPAHQIIYAINKEVSTANNAVVNRGQWNELIVVRESGTTVAYLNGVEIDRVENDTRDIPSQPMRLGMRHNGTYGFRGYIEEFRLTKGVNRYPVPQSSYTVPVTEYTNDADTILHIDSETVSKFDLPDRKISSVLSGGLSPENHKWVQRESPTDVRVTDTRFKGSLSKEFNYTYGSMEIAMKTQPLPTIYIVESEGEEITIFDPVPSYGAETLQSTVFTDSYDYSSLDGGQTIDVTKTTIQTDTYRTLVTYTQRTLVEYVINYKEADQSRTVVSDTTVETDVVEEDRVVVYDPVIVTYTIYPSESEELINTLEYHQADLISALETQEAQL